MNDDMTLRNLDINEILLSRLRYTYVKIEVLNYFTEKTIDTVEGEVMTGSITVDGDSTVRRIANLVFVATSNNFKILTADNPLSINKKIRISIGIRSNETQNEIYYFKMGIFVMTACYTTVTTQGHQINITAQDKMCLHNGTISGVINFTTRADVEVIDGTYQEALTNIQNVTAEIQALIKENYKEIPAGLKEKFDAMKPDLRFIYKLVANEDYAQESLIFTLLEQCDTIPAETDYKALKSQFKTFSNNVTKLSNNSKYKKLLIREIIKYAAIELAGEKPGRVVINDVDDKVRTPVMVDSEKGIIGFKMINYVYPTELTIATGQAVTAIYEACKNALGGNYEYFYDIDGNFIFQEIKNYKYNNIVPLDELRPNDYKVTFEKLAIQYDFSNDNIIQSYNNSPNWANIKNDFYVWGVNENSGVIGYHLVIDKKPFVPAYVKDTTRNVQLTIDGDIKRFDWREYVIHDYQCGEIWTFVGKTDETGIGDLTTVVTENNITNAACCVCLEDKYEYRYYIDGAWKVADSSVDTDRVGITPDYYEELISMWFPDRYEANFKIKPTTHVPMYNFDIIEGDRDLTKFSVKRIGKRTVVLNDTNVKQLYPTEVQEILVYMDDSDLEYTSDPTTAIKVEKIEDFENYKPVGNVYKDAFSAIKDLLWEHTLYNEQITLISMPIYYLEPNRRCYVYNYAASINGYYMLKRITFNLSEAGLMTVLLTSTNDRMARPDIKDALLTERENPIMTNSDRYIQIEEGQVTH